nr:hypothetical protein [Pseudonocardia sp. TRM90224]
MNKLIAQRRDGSVSQLNCSASTLFSVLTPPAMVRHFWVWTFRSWNVSPLSLILLQRRDGSESQLYWSATTLFSVLRPPAMVRHYSVRSFLIW